MTSKNRVVLHFASFLSLSATVVWSQDPAPRDTRALAVLQQAFAAMGSTVPSDSSAAGSIDLVEGSTTERGTIRILTRGLHQTAERIVTDRSSRSQVYSALKARLDATGLSFDDVEVAADGLPRRPLSVERALSSKSVIFPLIPVATVLSEPDFALEYVGQESLDSAQVHHIRVWKMFSSQPELRGIAEATTQDLWIDSQTGLPRKLSFEFREAGGAPTIPVEISFEDYRNVGGILYPHRIKKALNGTPWGSIIILQVSLNVGLSGAEFTVEKGAQ